MSREKNQERLKGGHVEGILPADKRRSHLTGDKACNIALVIISNDLVLNLVASLLALYVGNKSQMASKSK